MLPASIQFDHAPAQHAPCVHLTPCHATCHAGATRPKTKGTPPPPPPTPTTYHAPDVHQSWLASTFQHPLRRPRDSVGGLQGRGCQRSPSLHSLSLEFDLPAFAFVLLCSPGQQHCQSAGLGQTPRKTTSHAERGSRQLACPRPRFVQVLLAEASSAAQLPARPAAGEATGRPGWACLRTRTPCFKAAPRQRPAATDAHALPYLLQ